jgi:hypothetical protein
MREHLDGDCNGRQYRASIVGSRRWCVDLYDYIADADGDFVNVRGYNLLDRAGNRFAGLRVKSEDTCSDSIGHIHRDRYGSEWVCHDRYC